MRLRHALAACVLVASAALPGVLGASSALAAQVDLTCANNVVPGNPLTTPDWPATQLQFQELASVNQGQYVSPGRFAGQSFAAGDPVPVAVIDSGLLPSDPRKPPSNPIFEGADIPPGPHQVQPWRLYDCAGHGTAVASLIVGQPGQSTFEGIAPRVRLLPIQYTNMENGGTAPNLTAALTYAIAQHPRVINMSLQMPNKPLPKFMALLRTAERDKIVIVAAGGNDDGQGTGRVYPAALSGQFDNIIAVSAIGQDGTAAGFGITGHYIDVAAPGVSVPAALRDGGVKADEMGTSFAAPLVTGTVALMLATHPDMSPAQVKNRLEATADPPPGKQPNSLYGYGPINPLNAVTSVRNDSVATPSPKPGRPLAAPRPAAAPSRSLEHRALAVAVALLGLAALTVTGAAVLRGSRRAQARRS